MLVKQKIKNGHCVKEITSLPGYEHVLELGHRHRPEHYRDGRILVRKQHYGVVESCTIPTKRNEAEERRPLSGNTTNSQCADLNS